MHHLGLDQVVVINIFTAFSNVYAQFINQHP